MKLKILTILSVIALLAAMSYAQPSTYKTHKEAMAGGESLVKSKSITEALAAYSAAVELAKTDDEKAEALIAKAGAESKKEITEKSKVLYSRAERSRLESAKNILLQVTTLPQASDESKAKAFFEIIEMQKKLSSTPDSNRAVNDYYKQLIALPNLSLDTRVSALKKRGGQPDFVAITKLPGVSDAVLADAYWQLSVSNIAYVSQFEKIETLKKIVALENAAAGRRSDAVFKLADFYAKDKKYDEMQADLAKVPMFKGVSAEDEIKAYHYLANLHLFLKNVPAAQAELKKIDKIKGLTDDQKAEAYRESGGYYLKYKMFDAAVLEAERAKKLKKISSGELAKIHYFAADIYSQQINYAKAREEWNKVAALKVDKKFQNYQTAALQMIGKSYYSEKNYAEASKAFKRLADLKDISSQDLSIAQYLHGSSLLAENKNAAARAEFEKVEANADAKPLDRINASKHIIATYKNENKPNEAAAAYVRLIPQLNQNTYDLNMSEIDRRNVANEYARLRADSMNDAAEFAKNSATVNAALTIYNGYVDYHDKTGRDPQSKVRAYIAIGDIYMSQNKFAESKNVYEKALAIGISTYKKTLDTKIAEANLKLANK